MAENEEFLDRISVNPEISRGQPIIRGRRLTAEHVLGMLAAGDSVEPIQERYHSLEREDVFVCQLFKV